MYVNIKKAPGGRVPGEFRITFHTSPAERPLEHIVVGDAATLQEFLEKKLELSEPLARSYANEAEFSRVAHFDRLSLTQDEIRKMLRLVAAEEKLAAAEARKGGTVPPKEATT